MLQINKTNTSISSTFSSPEMLSPAEMLEAGISFVRQQFHVVAFVTIVALTLGIIYLAITPVSYTATARMIIDTRKVQLSQQATVGDIPIDSRFVESQVEVLKSENVARSVITDLHLTDDPEFASKGRGLFGYVLGLGATSEFERAGQAIQVFQGRLGVKRVGPTYVIEISFRSVDAERAAQIANAVTEAYLQDQLRSKYEATRRASVWLQNRIQELRQQTEGAERAVVDFKTKNNIVTTGGTGNRLVSEQLVAELSSRLVLVRAQTADARAKLDRIEAVLRADTPNATVNSTVTDTLTNEVINKLRSQYLELANREVDWSTRYGRDHLAAVNLRNQMREIRNSILDELRRIAESYKSDFEIASDREEQIQKELALAVSQSQDTNQAQVALRELESSSQTYRSLYDNFLQRYTESIQQQSFPVSEARVMSEAAKPLRKSHPRTALILVIAGFAGVACGVGIGMVRILLDQVFRTPDQMANLLGTDCLAVVPLLKGAPATLMKEKAIKRLKSKTTWRWLLLGAPPQNDQAGDARKNVGDKSILWAVLHHPFSRYTEAVRSIKLAIDLNGVVKSTKVIGFTSSVPNEGKTSLALSLAQLMAQVGAKVILVDCDIRNPSMSRTITPAAEAGLLEVIAGTVPLTDAVWNEETMNLDFLPAVVPSGVAHSNEILASGRTKTFFNSLREKYDYVIADFSPLAPVVDVRATADLVDSYIFVVEWGKTKIDVVKHALGGAHIVRDRMLGAVLNKTDMEAFSRYEGRRRNDYYFNKYYSKYGYTD